MPEYKFHPAANIFPIDDENIDALSKDIEEHGLREPILLLDSCVLDGRRRLEACRRADVKPLFKDVATNDPVALVLSLNLHRRHLTTSQLAMVADKVREYHEKQAKDRMRAGGGDHKSEAAKSGMKESPYPIEGTGASRDKAGAAVGVSGYSVDRARKVRRDGIPELANAVDAGRIAVDPAADIAALPKNEQADALQEALKPKSRSPRQRSEPVAPASADETGPNRIGVGVIRANEAIDRLKKIPKNDALRKRGFAMVKDWIKTHEKD